VKYAKRLIGKGGYCQGRRGRKLLKLKDLSAWDIFSAMFHAMVQKNWKAVLAGCELLKAVIAKAEGKN